MASGRRRPVWRTSRWAGALLFCGLLAALAAGLWGSYRMVFPARGVLRMAGTFQARAGDTMILVEHEAVTGLMNEMTSMAVVAESRDVLDQADLRRGDRVRLTVRQLPDKLLLVEIRKIP